jgi:HEAT repeat protein
VYDVLLALNGEEDRRLLEALSRAFLREMVALYPQVRVMALSRLACAGDRQALLDLRRALMQARPDDLEALTASARLGELQGVAGLRALATGGPFPSRALALQALQRVRDRSASEAVLAAIEHEDLYLRLTGIRAARLLAVEAARPRLRLLLSDPNVFVAAEAAASLAALGDVDAVGRLKALQTHPSPDVRLAVLIGLLSQGADPTVLTALEAVARSRNGSAWLAALETLLDAAPTRGAELLREALGDPNPNVRLLALRLFPRAGLPAEQDLAALRLQLREPQNFIKMEAATAILGPTDLCVP